MRAHAGGLIVGALATGLLLTLLSEAASLEGFLQQEVPGAAVAVILLLWTVRLITSRGLPWPSSGWQVPERWRGIYPPAFTVTAYGVLLGAGFLTAVVGPLYWLCVVLTLHFSSFFVSAGLWGVYAASRVAATARTSAIAAVDPSDADGVDRFARFARARGLSAATMSAAALLAVAGITSP